MAQILVFGDSIAWGAWDKEGGWVQRLKNFLDERTLSVPEFWDTDFFMVYNLGISGDSSEWLLERFDFEMKQRIKESDKSIVIFSIGSNDSSLRKNAFMVSPKKFKDNIENLIKLSKSYSSETIFVGLTPADEARSTPIPWNTDIYCKNEHIQKYDRIIKSVCAENKIRFIDIYETFEKTDYKKLLEDGLHPNSEGHKIIFETVKNFLVNEKII